MDFLSNIISGIIGGLIVYFVQILTEKQKRKNEDNINRIVGKPTLKYLDSNFLYNYTPGKVSIEKVFIDFGEPFTKSKGNLEDDDRHLSFYKYIFENAKVEFTTFQNESEILSITVFAYHDKKNPINCLFFPNVDEGSLGTVKITDDFIDNIFEFQGYSSPRDSFTIIKTRNHEYTTMKYLYLVYQISGNFDNINELKDKVIDQVCVTQLPSLSPTFSVWDTFYS